jgi:hypothetical protein
MKIVIAEPHYVGSVCAEFRKSRSRNKESSAKFYLLL